MNVDEEIIRVNANHERRYILMLAHEKIVGIECKNEPLYDDYGFTAGGFDDAKGKALAIIADLIASLNV